jgi:hypothetical protein
MIANEVLARINQKALVDTLTMYTVMSLSMEKRLPATIALYADTIVTCRTLYAALEFGCSMSDEEIVAAVSTSLESMFLQIVEPIDSDDIVAAVEKLLKETRT